MRARRIVVLVLFATASCLSFGDLTGGGETDSGTDATFDDASASTTDAAAIDDAPVSTDASAPDGDFCAGKDAAFCFDFDQPGTFASGGWAVFDTGGLSTLTVVDGGTSSPSCLRSDIPPANDATVPNQIASQLKHTLVGTFSQVVYQFDFSIDNADTTLSLAYFASLDIVTPKSDTELRLGMRASGNFLFSDIEQPDGGKFFGTVSPQIAFTNGAWHHAEIDIDVSVAPATSKVTLDGNVVQAGNVMGAVYGKGTVTVGAGFVYATVPCGEWTLRTDNVAVYAN